MGTVRKWGSITILSGLGGTLTAALIIWLFGNSFNNTLILTPLVTSLDRLSTTIDKREDMNSKEHELIVDELKTINGRININETKLFRVVSDCQENHNDIKTCQRIHR